jgi:hypothetical protein
MARQSHTVYQLLGSYPSVSADVFEKTAVAADAVNFESVTFTGREIVVAYNSGATPRLVTIESIADSHQRTGDLTETVAAGKFAFFGPLSLEGWVQTTGVLNFKAAHADVLFVVLRLP